MNLDIKELRIGNWVLYKERYQRMKMPLDLMMCKMCEPIPLTEEILLKCGFEKYLSDAFRFEKFEFCLDAYSFFIQNIGYGYAISKNIKHLHQLQNLYFALTGKELDVEL